MDAATPSSSTPPSRSVELFGQFRLERTPFGRLLLSFLDGSEVVDVVAVRSFPIAAPNEGIALVGPDGRERAWIDSLLTLEPACRTLIEDELRQRELVPVISRLVSVSTFSTPSIWRVETDRGATELVLKAEEDIRRVPGGALLITSAQGLVFRVDDARQLDRASRRFLDRFL